jgi:hypothetical protein|tara:strand:+ start:107 stop:319 length:213 start_codon:yes stop_codon:yes gene_type:complete
MNNVEHLEKQLIFLTRGIYDLEEKEKEIRRIRTNHVIQILEEVDAMIKADIQNIKVDKYYTCTYNKDTQE